MLLSGFSTAVAALEPGDAARDFALIDGSGAIVTLSDIRQGATLTVLEMVNSYCDSCRKMSDDLNTLAEAYRQHGVRFVAVALANTQQEVAAMSSSWDMTYPVLADPEKITMHLYAAAKSLISLLLIPKALFVLAANSARLKNFRKKLINFLRTHQRALLPGMTHRRSSSMISSVTRWRFLLLNVIKTPFLAFLELMTMPTARMPGSWHASMISFGRTACACLLCCRVHFQEIFVTLSVKTRSPTRCS